MPTSLRQLTNPRISQIDAWLDLDVTWSFQCYSRTIQHNKKYGEVICGFWA